MSSPKTVILVNNLNIKFLPQRHREHRELIYPNSKSQLSHRDTENTENM